MPSTPRSSSCSTRPCAASPSPSAAGSCSPLPTKPRPSGCAAACRGGARASSARSSIFVGGHFGEYQRLGDAAIAVLGDFTPLVERISIDEAFADVAGCTHLFGPPAEIATRDPAPRAGGARPADLGRRGAHQASGENRLAGGQARRAAGRRSRHRAGVPARPAGRADVGRGPGRQGAAGGDRRADHRPAGEDAGALAGAIARPGGGREAGGAGVESRSAGDQAASPGAIGRRAIGDRQEARRGAGVPAHAAPSRRQDRRLGCGPNLCLAEP